jgi:membrane-bound lytic murein transglycosylase A
MKTWIASGRTSVLWVSLGVLLASCAAPPPKAPPPPPAPVAAPAPAPVAAPPKPVVPIIDTEVGRLVPVDFSELTEFSVDPLDDVHKTFRFSCQYFRNRKQAQWTPLCERLGRLAPTDQAGLRALLMELQPYRIETDDGKAAGTITGYYEPVLRGSRIKRNPYLHALYNRPSDLVVVTQGNAGARGRKVGEKLVPYFTREEIYSPSGQQSMSGREIVWVDDPMDVLLIEVQGSGRVMLPDGSAIRLSYADHNGHPRTPYSQWFRANGLPNIGSMEEISRWARTAPPERVKQMSNSNAQVVFFRWEPVTDVTVGPAGATGTPVVPMRSIAIDPRSIPLGAPVWIEFRSPINKDVMYRRLVFGSDTGGSIKGAVRADYFWGFGQQALQMARATRTDQGRMWVLLPKPAAQ